jgi:YidC/Oxa1 family membrane protein insertase
MEFWNAWTELLTYCVGFFSEQWGLSEAMAIITFTLIARVLLLPISFRAALDMHKNKQVMEKLKPKLAKMQERYRDNPAEIAQRTMAMYKKHGVRFFGKLTFLNIGTQGIVGLGLFQSLKSSVFGSAFMWISNIAKPDALLAMLVGVLTFLTMFYMPGGAEQSSLLIFIIPALISMFVLISFPSAIGIYWATSNIVTLLQTVLLRIVVARNQHSAASV